MIKSNKKNSPPNSIDLERIKKMHVRTFEKLLKEVKKVDETNRDLKKGEPDVVEFSIKGRGYVEDITAHVDDNDGKTWMHINKAFVNPKTYPLVVRSITTDYIHKKSWHFSDSLEVTTEERNDLTLMPNCTLKFTINMGDKKRPLPSV